VGFLRECEEGDGRAFLGGAPSIPIEAALRGSEAGGISVNLRWIWHPLVRPLALAAVLAPLAPAAMPQVSYSAVQPTDSGFGPLDTSAPSIPVDQIIQKFAAKESQFRRALDSYTYTRSVKIDTIDDDGKVDGEYQQVTDISYDPTSGAKLEHVTFAPANTLQRIMMSPADFSDIEHRLPFVLTTEDLPAYHVTYVGKQRIDQIDNYVFDVAPKKIEKNHRYLQGRIWVDQQDLQIVVVSGKNVPDDLRRGHEDLSPPFSTWRQQVDGKYWFPVYTKADAVLHFPGGNGYLSQDVRIRYVVRYTNYKRFGTSVKVTYDGQDISNNNAQPAPAPQQGVPPQRSSQQAGPQTSGTAGPGQAGAGQPQNTGQPQ
jgi:hypothetical protein